MTEKKTIDKKNIFLNRKNHGQTLDDIEDIKNFLIKKHGYAPDVTAITRMALSFYLKSLRLGITID